MGKSCVLATMKVEIKELPLNGNSFKNCRAVFKKFESALVAFVSPALF